MLERSLAMAYTGDARVITTDLMGPFRLKRSLIEHGLPSITMGLSFNQGLAEYFAQSPANWPLNKFQEPAISSKRAQVLTYSIDHFTVNFNLNNPCVH